MKLPSILFLIQFISFLPSFGQQSSITDARLLVSEFVIENNIPGLSITITKDDSIVWSEGFGYTDVELREPVDPAASKFRIGSVSKTFTAAALGVLMDEDKIDLDQPIQTYVPSFPEKQWDISLRQLAGHLAGIRHYRGDEFLSTKFYPSVAEGLEIFEKDKLLHEPGTKYSYSSYGWNLISVAIENITDEPFLAYMHQQVFEPLDMKNTVPDINSQIIFERTAFYVHSDDGTIRNAPYVDNSYKWAGGGFLSTTEDLAKFGNAFLDTEYLTVETIEEMQAPQQTSDGETTDYGLGWRTYHWNDQEWLGHSGGSVGGTTIFILSEEEDMVVAMAANLSGVNYDNLHFKIADLFTLN